MVERLHDYVSHIKTVGRVGITYETETEIPVSFPLIFPGNVS
jgi:hypothetical protein